MTNIKIIQEVKRHTALKAEHSDLKNCSLPENCTVFGAKVHKDLEDTDRNSTAVAKHNTPAKGRNTIRTHKFVKKRKYKKNTENY